MRSAILLGEWIGVLAAVVVGLAPEAPLTGSASEMDELVSIFAARNPIPCKLILI